MLGKKQELPPPTNEIENLKKIKADLERQKTEMEQQEVKQKPILPPPPEHITNEQIAQMLNELYTILTNKYDMLYYKIDQTQDLIINKTKNK